MRISGIGFRFFRSGGWLPSGLPRDAAWRILPSMIDRSMTFESLTAQERIALMGRLWDSLDTAAAPMSPTLAAELERREAEADADPEAGVAWETLRAALRAHLR